MTEVTPKKSSFVSFSGQNKSLFATDVCPTCLWFGWLFGANPTLQENKHYLGGETSPHELSHAWQRQHLNARRQEGCTRHQLGKRITNKQTGTAGEHYRDEGNHLSIDEEDLLHLDEDEASVAFSWTGSLANVQGISTVLIHKRFCTLASPAMWMPRVLFSSLFRSHTFSQIQQTAGPINTTLGMHICCTGNTNTSKKSIRVRIVNLLVWSFRARASLLLTNIHGKPPAAAKRVMAAVAHIACDQH